MGEKTQKRQEKGSKVEKSNSGKSPFLREKEVKRVLMTKTPPIYAYA